VRLFDRDAGTFEDRGDEIRLRQGADERGPAIDDRMRAPRTRNWFERYGNSFASTQTAVICGDASAIRLARLTARGQ